MTPMKKSGLRKIYLDRRMSLTSTERKEKSRAIADLFFQNFDLKEIGFLHCFVPIEKFGEIETGFIYEKIWRRLPDVQTLAPRVDFSNGEIENFVFAHNVPLAENVWQIREPADGEEIEAEKIDAVLIPLLCFDCSGFRVGYGKGFYDRFLRKCRNDCLKIGLSFFEPIEKIIDAQEFDVKLDFCVTPEKVYEFAS